MRDYLAIVMMPLNFIEFSFIEVLVNSNQYHKFQLLISRPRVIYNLVS